MKDHRQIGRELDLFSFHEAAPGAVFWHPKGWVIYRILQEFIQEKTAQEGYLEISTPVMVKSQLFKESGHWEHFGEHNMFNMAVYDREEEEEIHKLIIKKVKEEYSGKNAKWVTVSINYHNEDLDVKIGEIRWEGTNAYINGIYLPVNYSLKPMNCPESALIFRSRVRSYQDLPIRLSEFGILHRRERSGVLGGLLRIRQFTIDDAHLFVRADQIQDEIHKLILLVIGVYKSLGFKPRFYLATKPDKAMGDNKTWKEAEYALEKTLKDAKVNFDIKPKDGAFYGPKIDIHVSDSQERDWQLATIQLDFQIPERMKLAYIAKDGTKKQPIMIHRGIFGSIERFVGILLEHTQGSLPVWLAPVQAVVIPISDKNSKYAQSIFERLKEEKIRVKLNVKPETLQAKIRDATLQKVPFMVICGTKEEKTKTVSVRTRDGEDLGQVELQKFLQEISQQIISRTIKVASSI